MGMTKRQEQTFDNGPRITTDHGKVIGTETLVERGPNHPAGPGVTVIRSYASKESK